MRHWQSLMRIIARLGLSASLLIVPMSLSHASSDNMNDTVKVTYSTSQMINSDLDHQVQSVEQNTYFQAVHGVDHDSDAIACCEATCGGALFVSDTSNSAQAVIFRREILIDDKLTPGQIASTYKPPSI